jgi:hypothetical protein
VGAVYSRADPRDRYPTLLRSWSVPFLWLTLIPLVTVPLSAVLYRYDVFAPGHDGCTEWIYNDFDGFGENRRSLTFFPFYDCGLHPVSATILAFTVPGLLNLVPLLWAVLSTVPITRLAGIVAGVLGIFRLALPAILIEVNIDDVWSEYDAAARAQFGGYVWGLADTIYIFGTLAWLGCLFVWGGFAVLVDSGVIGYSSERRELPDLPPPRTRTNQEKENLAANELEAPDYLTRR